MQRKVVILGAGPAGMSCAWECARRGAAVELIEKDPLVGGLCHTTRRDGFTFDFGGHRFITADAQLLDAVSSLLGDSLQQRPRTSIIVLRGKSYQYPLQFADVVRKLPAHVSLCAGIDLLASKAGWYHRRSDRSLEDWVVKRFGKTLYDIYFGPYSRKLWGIPPSHIAAEWAAQRISLVDLSDVIVRALGKKSRAPRTYRQTFWYPSAGIGMICERMLEEVRAAGGTVRLHTRATGVRCEQGRVTGVSVSTAGQREETIPSDFVISTIPLPELVSGMQPQPPEEIRRAAGALRFRSLRMVHVMLQGDFVTGNTWIYVPDEHYVFFRIQDRRNWHPDSCPPGMNALTFEIACDKGDALWEAPEEALVRRCLDDLARLGIDVRTRVRGSYSERAEHGYPVYTLSYRQAVEPLLRYVGACDGLISIGRQGLFRYNNMDHSMSMGILTAQHWLNGAPRKDIFRVATEQESFEKENEPEAA